MKSRRIEKEENKRDDRKLEKYWTCPNKLFGTKCVLASGDNSSSTSSSSPVLWPHDKKNECDNSCGLPSELQHFIFSSSSFLGAKERSSLRPTSKDILRSTTTDIERKLLQAINPEKICVPIYGDRYVVHKLTESEMKVEDEIYEKELLDSLEKRRKGQIELENQFRCGQISSLEKERRQKELDKEYYDTIPVKQTTRRILENVIWNYRPNADTLNFITRTLATSQACSMVNEVLQRILNLNLQAYEDCNDILELYTVIVSSLSTGGTTQGQCPPFYQEGVKMLQVLTQEREEKEEKSGEENLLQKVIIGELNQSLQMNLSALLDTLVQKIIHNYQEYKGDYYDALVGNATKLFPIFVDILDRMNSVANIRSDEDGNQLGEWMKKIINRKDVQLSGDRDFTDAVSNTLLELQRDPDDPTNRKAVAVLSPFLHSSLRTIPITSLVFLDKMFEEGKTSAQTPVEFMVAEILEDEVVHMIAAGDINVFDANILRNLLNRFYNDEAARAAAEEEEQEQEEQENEDYEAEEEY